MVRDSSDPVGVTAVTIWALGAIEVAVGIPQTEGGVLESGGCAEADRPGPPDYGEVGFVGVRVGGTPLEFEAVAGLAGGAPERARGRG